MTQHLDEVLATCASSMYALRVLRSHGHPPSAIHEVARMTTVVASLMYASPEWLGFTLARDRSRVEQLLRRMIRCGFLPPYALTADQLAASADAQHFKAIILNPYHVLNSRLPEKYSTNYSFRPRAHEFGLPRKDDKNFLPRLLRVINIY